MTRIFFLSLSSTLLFSCASTKNSIDPYSHIDDKEVVAILKKSFKTLGGLENWQNKQELHYEKLTKNLSTSGDIESEIFQSHDYYYGDQTNINISWKEDGKEAHRIESIDNQATKYVANQRDRSADQATLDNSITVSLFVINVPFKLIDEGIELTYEGTETLEDGQQVDVIKAVYDADKHPHHTKSDLWWYYFDKEDARMVAYFIFHDGHYSYIKNLDYTTVSGFLVPTKRRSYLVNENRKILHTKVEYEYLSWNVLM